MGLQITIFKTERLEWTHKYYVKTERLERAYNYNYVKLRGWSALTNNRT